MAAQLCAATIHEELGQEIVAAEDAGSGETEHFWLERSSRAGDEERDIRREPIDARRRLPIPVESHRPGRTTRPSL